MATAFVIFHQAGNRSRERESMPVILLAGSKSLHITTSALNVDTVIVADGFNQNNKYDGGFVTIMAMGSNLWVDAGPDPNAVVPTLDGAAGSGFPIKDGYSITFGVKDDDKISLVEF